MTNENELDPVLTRTLASIHPTQLVHLRRVCLTVLAGATGIDPDHDIFAQLVLAQTVDDLARMDWEALLADVCFFSRLSAQSCAMTIAHLRLFVERAVLHACLYRSKSATTLWLLGEQWPIPRRGWPATLALRYRDFWRACHEADMALEQGRAALQAFMRALTGVEHTLDRAQALLTRANGCYADYLQSLYEANQVAESIRWHLAAMHGAPDDKAQPGRRVA